MVESSDKMWSTGEGNRKPLQYSCLEKPMNRMKRKKDMTLKDELPRLVGAQYVTGEEWGNYSRKNEEMETKQKQRPVVNVTGDKSKVQCCKEQYCIGMLGPWIKVNWKWPEELPVSRRELNARTIPAVLGWSLKHWLEPETEIKTCGYMT